MVGVVDWIDMAGYGDQLRAVVNALMKLYVS